MLELSIIGLDKKKAQVLSKQLNELLANFQIYYQNLRGFHWNIQGRDFFELHLKFEELYNIALSNIDEIAERILTIGQKPLHSFSDYLKKTNVKEIKNCTSGEQAIEHILNDINILLKIERETLTTASNAKDEGTVSLLSGYIQAQEKLVWMLTARKK